MQSLPFESGDPKWWKSSHSKLNLNCGRGGGITALSTSRNCNVYGR